MPLTPGARIGAFEVVGALGAGGMGEVYRARDTRLDRDVALKILPESFAVDPDRRARFEREARALAALNHPNIAQVYGFEIAGDVHAIAMELVEGRTLAESIAAGPLSVTEALAIARQLATALDAAHEQGIVHRDLKPANVIVRDDGTVKVLDFGLAKAFATDVETSGANVANSPTLTARATQLGMIIGTAAYMAPEQAKGRSVDRRADIWAFGVVLYEMIAGRRAFEGDDISDVLASVLKTDPDWTALPADLPAPVRRLLRRCLEKDPKRRLRDLSEGMLQLDEELAAPTTTATATITGTSESSSILAPRTLPWWRRVLPAAAVLVVAMAIAAAGWFRPTPEPPRDRVTFTHVPSPELAYFSTQGSADLAMSRSGRFFVYTSGNPSRIRLVLRRLDALDGVVIRGADGVNPFFSADEDWVGFLDFSDRTIVKKVPVDGGPATTITKAKSPILGATWLADNSIVLGGQSGLWRVPPGGGDPVLLTEVDRARNETGHLAPAAIPETDFVLFITSAGSPLTDSKLAVVNVATREVTRFDVAGVSPKYLPTGHIAFAVRDGSIRVVGFDVGRVQTSGNPVPMLEGVAVKPSGAASFDVARDGRIVYASGGGTAANRTVAWADRTGRETVIPTPQRAYFYVRASPTESLRLTLDVRDEGSDIWVWDARGTLTKLTPNDGIDQYGLWMPDGRQVVFTSAIEGKAGIFRTRADGIGQPELLVEHNSAFPNAVTPDGKFVVFRAATSGRNDLFLVATDGERKATPLVATEHDELNAAVSPDGRWIAFQSDLSGRHEVYLRPFPDVNGGQWPVSTTGGSEPAWSPSGRELYYLSADNKMMAVDFTAEPAVALKAPTVLFDAAGYFFGGIGRNYDVARDGRFLLIKNGPNEALISRPITVVLNWAEQLRTGSANR